MSCLCLVSVTRLRGAASAEGADWAAMLEFGSGWHEASCTWPCTGPPFEPDRRPRISLPSLPPPPMAPAGLDVVIWGITAAGRTFRPSDWADRIAGLTSAFGDDRKLVYSPLVLPVMVGGTRAVIVGHELEAIEPRLFRFLLSFAQDNELQVQRTPNARAVPHGLVPPQPATGAGKEPREPI